MRSWHCRPSILGLDSLVQGKGELGQLIAKHVLEERTKFLILVQGKGRLSQLGADMPESLVQGKGKLGHLSAKHCLDELKKLVILV